MSINVPNELKILLLIFHIMYAMAYKFEINILIYNSTKIGIQFYFDFLNNN